MQVIETPVYTFDELSDEAKEKARDWWRELRDSSDLDPVIEDFEQCAGILGVEVNRRGWRSTSGATGTEPAIRWGLYTQGSGASFEGSYRYKKGAAKAIRAYTGNSDAELIRIADELQAIQKRHGYGLEARMTDGPGSNFYPHSGTMAVEVQTRSGDYPDAETESAITELMRDLANWLYGKLEAEDMYQNEDEQVDDMLTANEYTFTAEGKRFG
jgi:hypothetical protein